METVGPEFWIAAGIYGVVFGVISGSVWKSKDGSFEQGMLLGFFLGIIGLAIVGFSKPTPARHLGVARSIKLCPACQSSMDPLDVICPNCGEASRPWQREGNHWAWTTDTGERYVLDEKKDEWKKLH